MKKYKEATLRKRLMKWVMACRFAIVVLPVISLLLSGLRPDEFRQLFFLIAPVSGLYFTLFVKYFSQNYYEYPGLDLNPEFSDISYSLILGCNILQILLISCRSLFALPETDWFFGIVGSIEIFLAAYAGYYLSDLFNEAKVR